MNSRYTKLHVELLNVQVGLAHGMRMYSDIHRTMKGWSERFQPGWKPVWFSGIRVRWALDNPQRTISVSSLDVVHAKLILATFTWGPTHWSCKLVLSLIYISPQKSALLFNLIQKSRHSSGLVASCPLRKPIAPFIITGAIVQCRVTQWIHWPLPFSFGFTFP